MSFFQRNYTWGPLFLRVGLALTLWYSAWQNSMRIDEVAKTLSDLKIPGASIYLAWALVLFLAFCGFSLILKIWQKRLAFLLCVFFVITLITVPWSDGHAVWKDMALLGAALWWLFTTGY